MVFMPQLGRAVLVEKEGPTQYCASCHIVLADQYTLLFLLLAFANGQKCSVDFKSTTLTGCRKRPSSLPGNFSN